MSVEVVTLRPETVLGPATATATLTPDGGLGTANPACVQPSSVLRGPRGVPMTVGVCQASHACWLGRILLVCRTFERSGNLGFLCFMSLHETP